MVKSQLLCLLRYTRMNKQKHFGVTLGIEPKSLESQTRVLPLNDDHPKVLYKTGCIDRPRTCAIRVNSAALYQLSYDAKMTGASAGIRTLKSPASKAGRCTYFH